MPLFTWYRDSVRPFSPTGTKQYGHRASSKLACGCYIALCILGFGMEEHKLTHKLFLESCSECSAFSQFLSRARDNNMHRATFYCHGCQKKVAPIYAHNLPHCSQCKGDFVECVEPSPTTSKSHSTTSDTLAGQTAPPGAQQASNQAIYPSFSHPASQLGPHPLPKHQNQYYPHQQHNQLITHQPQANHPNSQATTTLPTRNTNTNGVSGNALPNASRLFTPEPSER